MPCGERKSNGSGVFISLTNDATKSEKSFDPHFRLMIPPDATIVARPLSPARPANGKIGTRLRKSDKKATGALGHAQEESLSEWIGLPRENMMSGKLEAKI